MTRYTYTLNPNRKEAETGTYKQRDLEKMTTFHLREICKKERLVMPFSQTNDREGLIRLIMRFRGQKEYRHIKTFSQGGLERIQEVFDANKVSISENPNVRIPGTIVLYRETGMNELDSCQVQTEEPLYEGNVFLIDEAFCVYTCFYMKKIDKAAYLFKGQKVPVRPLEKHMYYILYLPREQDLEFFYDCYYGKKVHVPGGIQGVRIPLLDVQEKEIATTDFPLVINFGSSDTTMGICLPDGSVKLAQAGGVPIIPSMIGIKQPAVDEDGLVLGYDAQALRRQMCQNEDTAFYNIKRWIRSADREESAVLKNGYQYQFPRKKLLQAYLNYLLELAEQQFKSRFINIQLLIPLREKKQFQKLFQELLPEYRVSCDLDEGTAVLFHSISRMIKKKRYEEGHWYNALIVDCGGETIDLTSGRFCIKNNRISYDIELESCYENGNVNFGGNNLTYRILQMLKIRITEELGFLKQESTVKEEGEEYQRLKERYRQSEYWLPTCFKDYEDKGREDYFFVKNNYYYLFELSEQIKKHFFQLRLPYELVISTQREEAKDGLFLDKWKLAVCQEGRLEPISVPVKFSVYLNEIEDLLRPDIYQQMACFLDKKFDQGELQNYEMIQMTGQSCKSRLFTEALKQYVPGKLIQNTKQEDDRIELKISCLEGALAYFWNCRLGYMKVKQSGRIGSLPYEIMAFTHENKEKVLLKSQTPENYIGSISRFHIGNQLDLYLNDAQGKKLKTYYFEYDSSKFQRTTQEEINRLYEGTVIQEETDTISEGEIKFFVWRSNKGWGFVVLPILRAGELLYQGEETFFSFEDGTWEMDFFDGKK